MWGTCWKCGAKNADVNPYRDSPYFGLCYVCQMKEVEERRRGSKISYPYPKLKTAGGETANSYFFILILLYLKIRI